MISFVWPWVFLMLPLPLLLRARSVRGSDKVYIPPDLEQALQNTESTAQPALRFRLLPLWLAWGLCLLCIAQPWIPGDAVAQPVSGRALAIAVDVSSSMERKDFKLDGVQSDRLTVLKAVARRFISARSGDRVSLVLYGSKAFIASPLTFDLNSVSSILDSAGIGMAGNSTAIGDAIGLAINTLVNDPAGNKAIVLLSDGTNNTGSVEPESAASLAASLDIRIHTIAMGTIDTDISGYATAKSADLDEDTLMAIAEMSGGGFFRAASYSDLNEIYRAIDQLERADVVAPPVVLRHDLHLWPLSLLGSMLIAMAIYRRVCN